MVIATFPQNLALIRLTVSEKKCFMDGQQMPAPQHQVYLHSQAELKIVELRIRVHPGNMAAILTKRTDINSKYLFIKQSICIKITSSHMILELQQLAEAKIGNTEKSDMLYCSEKDLQKWSSSLIAVFTTLYLTDLSRSDKGSFTAIAQASCKIRSVRVPRLLGPLRLSQLYTIDIASSL